MKTVGRLRPSTTDEYFALLLAARLNDLVAANHYVELCRKYAPSQILGAYQGCKDSLNRARAFHAELDRAEPLPPSFLPTARTAAIRVERRAVAIVVFAGDHLKHADGVHLSTSIDRARNTAAAFLEKIISKFRFETLAIEAIAGSPDVQRTQLLDDVRQIAHEAGLAVAEVAETEIFRSFGHPRLRARRDTREVISTIFPVLDQASGRPWTYDAAALGLFVQTDRLFN